MSLLPFTDFTANESLDDASPDQSAVIAEGLNATISRAGAVAGLIKINQLRQRVLQDRTAGAAEKNLAEMLFWVGSLAALVVGSITNDSELVNRAKGGGSK
jgi:hypothetical protein